MTEWHAPLPRPRRDDLLAVEKRARLIVLQPTQDACSSSEVAAMMEGLLHHGTDVPVEANYVDTHGAGDIGDSRLHLPARLLPAPGG